MMRWLALMWLGAAACSVAEAEPWEYELQPLKVEADDECVCPRAPVACLRECRDAHFACLWEPLSPVFERVFCHTNHDACVAFCWEDW